MTPAQLIAANLAALPHPDGIPRQLPAFNTQLLPEALQQQVSKTADDIGQAIVHLLESHGYTITTQPAQPEPTRTPTVATVVCSHCDTKVLQLNILNPDRVASLHHFTRIECPNR